MIQPVFTQNPYLVLVKTDAKKRESKGNLLASIGGLCTILSLIVFEGSDWAVYIALVGVILAIVGVGMTQKKQEATKQGTPEDQIKR